MTRDLSVLPSMRWKRVEGMPEWFRRALAAIAMAMVIAAVAFVGMDSTQTVLLAREGIGRGQGKAVRQLKSSLKAITNKLSSGDRSQLGALVDAVVAESSSGNLVKEQRHSAQENGKRSRSGSDILRWVDAMGVDSARHQQEQPAEGVRFWPEKAAKPSSACGDGCLDTLGERMGLVNVHSDKKSIGAPLFGEKKVLVRCT